MHFIGENWEMIKQTIHTEYDLTNISYNTWIEPLQFYDVKDDTVYIQIPTGQAHALNYISNKYSEIRRMFIPAEGCVLVDADYSQIELRLLAHISGDEAMRAAFTTGADIHTATAAQVFHVAPGDVTHEMRRRAKAVNFGIVYGISAFSLSQDIGVTVAEAKAYMEAYFATFPGVRKYMDDVVAKAKEQGYVETLFHRRRELPEIRSSNFNMRSFGERVALNMPIQGTAADIMKLAMVAVEKRLKRELPEAKLVLQVHDELIVECPKPQAAAAAKLLEEEMEQVAHLSVPLTAEAHWGRNWLEAKG